MLDVMSFYVVVVHFLSDVTPPPVNSSVNSTPNHNEVLSAKTQTSSPVRQFNNG